MNRFGWVVMAAALAGTSAFAHEGKDGDAMMEQHMKAMDTNGDGMISRDEFMKFHESMWDRMPKDANGMVKMDDMKKMHREKMHHGGMDHDRMDHDKAKKDDAMMKSKD